MDIKKLQSLVIDALEDVKAQDIMLFDTTHLTSLFDRIVIVSGTSNRHTKALAASVRDKVKEKGGDIVGIEGEDTGEWVLVDLGDMIVHIMQAPIRAYYRLEEIWGDKEIKLGAAKRVSKRTASETGDAVGVAAAPKKASRHLTTAQSPVTEIEVKPPVERKASTRKPVTRASAGKKPTVEAALEAVAAKTAAPKKSATKAAAPKKSAAKAAAKPVGKTVKVAATKSAVAAATELKARPPKPAAKAPKAAKPAMPVKTVIKRTVAKPKPAAE